MQRDGNGGVSGPAVRRSGCVVFLVSACLLLPGCGLTTAERVAWYEARIAEARRVLEQLDAQLDPAQRHLQQMEEQLRVVEAEDPDSELARRLRGAIERAAVAFEAAQQRRAEVFGVIESAEASVAALERPGAGWGDELAAAGEVGQAIAPLTGPAAPWVMLGSHLAAVLGGLLVRRPGDVPGREAKRREDEAWDEADWVAFERGYRAGHAEGRLPPDTGK